MRRIVLPLLFAALLAGCSRPDADLAPVTGQVFFRGKPLTGGTIVFTPDTERGGRGPQAMAELDGDGRFVLLTGGKKGAVAGWHLVTIAGQGETNALPGRYRDPDLSGQSFEVKGDRSNQCDLRLD